MAGRGFSFTSACIALVLLIGINGRFSANAYGQNSGPPSFDHRYSFILIHVPLTQALNELIDKTDIDIFFESELIRDKTAYCNIENALAKEALSCILEKAGLDYYQQSSGLYVITPSREDKPKYSSITGIIMDANTSEPLPYASIFLEEAETGAASNVEGRFAFSRLKPGKYLVKASHVAYQDDTDSLLIAPGTHHKLEIKLQPRTVMTTPIVVDGLHQRLPSESLNAFLVSTSALQNAPASSTPSTLQALDAVVGVHVGDALADVHVQGGDSGEHQYLLDGAPIFVPIRNGGFFGAFSPFALNQITVHKAGFEARHGSFLSGSIQLDHDVQSADGSLATVQIDPLSLNGRVNGAINRKNNVSAQWMLAGRVGLWEVFKPSQIDESFREWSRPNNFLTSSLTGLENATDPSTTNLADSLLNFAFSDIHAAARIRFGNAKSVYASIYQGNNDFGIGSIQFDPTLLDVEDNKPGEAYSWSNKMSQVRYEWVQGSRSFIKIGMWSSNYKLTHPFANSPFNAITPEYTSTPPEFSDDFNELKERGIHADIDWAPGSHHVVSANVEMISTEAEFKLSIDPFADSLQILDNSLKPLNWRIQSFLEDVISFSENTRLTIGSRFTYIPVQQRLYAEPRVSIRHDLPGNTWAVQFATGLYRQFYNQFDVASYNSSAILPSFRFWVPINKDTRASSAYHMAASLLFSPNEKWQVNVEGYYKYQPYLTILDYTARFEDEVINATSSRFFQRARGYAYGAGLSLAYRFQNLNFKTSYDYAVSRRKANNRFGGEFVPVPWETPHQLFAVIDYTVIKHLTFTIRWQGLFGRSWGFRRAYYDYLEPDPTLMGLTGLSLSRPQQHKLPAFTQWDLGISYSKRLGKIGVQGRLNFVNLLNETNVIDWVMITDQNGEQRRQSRTTTPFFPSASLKLTY